MFNPKSLVPKVAGPLRVIMLGRISTEHQNIENIDASYDEDERYLKRIYNGEMHVKRLGERGSGWKIGRATIIEALEEIKTGKWDVVITEDLGRAYRNPEFQYMIAHLCVDHFTRLICIGDGIDTGEPNWEPILAAAVMRHGMTVPEARRRVKRTATHSFHGGGMVLKTKYGYRRLTPDEAASGLFGPKGVRIAKVLEATPHIREMRDRFLRGDSYAAIADWLNDSGISPGPYAKSGVWKGQLVVDLFRAPILHGLRTFRDYEHTMIFSTGEHRRSKNESPEEVLIPELAHMTLEEQEILWAAMDEHAPPRDKDNPRKGVARRSSHWPGQHLRCAICSDEMFWVGPTQLRCRNASPGRPRTCWNQVIVNPEQARTKLIPVLLEKLRAKPELLNMIVDAAWSEFNRVGSRSHTRIHDLESRIADHKKDCDRITTLLIQRPDSESLLQRMDQAEQQLKGLRQQLVEERTKQRSDMMCLTRDEVVARLEEVVLHLSRTSFDFGKLMRRAFPDFKLVPVQALNTPQVHPRLKLTFQCDPTSGEGTDQIVVNAFDVPVGINHMEKCVQARAANPGLNMVKTAECLGLPLQTLKNSLKYYQLMKERGTSDPFIELKERPEKASRWRKDSLARPPEEPTGSDEEK